MINSLPVEYKTIKAIIIHSLTNKVWQWIYNSNQNELKNTSKETLLYANMLAPAWTTLKWPWAYKSNPQTQRQA